MLCYLQRACTALTKSPDPPDANSSLVHEPGSWIMGLENEVQVVPGVGQGLILCKKHLGCNWVVVKIMVPFWVPEILGAVL